MTNWHWRAKTSACRIPGCRFGTLCCHRRAKSCLIGNIPFSSRRRWSFGSGCRFFILIWRCMAARSKNAGRSRPSCADSFCSHHGVRHDDSALQAADPDFASAPANTLALLPVTAGKSALRERAVVAVDDFSSPMNVETRWHVYAWQEGKLLPLRQAPRPVAHCCRKRGSC